MSQELIGIIIAAIALAAILVPGQWALRRDIAALGERTRKDIAALGERTRKDIAALAESTRKDIAALGERTRKDIAALNERMAKIEGLFEGFTKSFPTPQ